MTAPILSLRAIIRTVLGNKDLVIYDEARDAVMPYASFGEWTARVWNDGSTLVAEHRFAIHVWSRAPGDAEALDLSGRIAATIDATQPPPPIVHWTVKAYEIRRPTREGVRSATVRVTALSELPRGDAS